MSDPEVDGIFEQILLADSGQAPHYVIKFDKAGRCVSPRSRAHLLEAIRVGKASHVIVFSHGWNNDWKDVGKLTGTFFKSFAALSPAPAPRGKPFQPIFVSLFWPSIALVLPRERGPHIAADGAVAASDTRAVAFVAAALPSRVRARVRELASHTSLGPHELHELAGILAPLFVQPDDEEGVAGQPDPESLVRFWQAAVARLKGKAVIVDPGFGDDEDEEPVADPQAAGWVMNSVRLPYRIATVWQMKDRAGLVGACGVGPLLRDVLSAHDDTRVHVLGHSYGCRVTLAALCAEAPPRPITSLLLLQPAVSHLCFAENVPGMGRPGGYRSALQRVRQPIIVTYSEHDWELHYFFQVALRRLDDLGELRPAAGDPPSRYAALGGYGPGGVGDLVRMEPPRVQGTVYDVTVGGARILAIDGAATQKPDGSPVIAGHGDVNSLYTWWMLYSQVAAS